MGYEVVISGTNIRMKIGSGDGVLVFHELVCGWTRDYLVKELKKTKKRIDKHVDKETDEFQAIETKHETIDKVLSMITSWLERQYDGGVARQERLHYDAIFHADRQPLIDINVIGLYWFIYGPAKEYSCGQALDIALWLKKILPFVNEEQERGYDAEFVDRLQELFEDAASEYRNVKISY